MATTTKTIRLTEQLLTFSKDAMSKYATLILGSIVFLMAILYVVFRPTDVVRPSLITVEVQSGILAFKEYVSNKLGFIISYPDTWTYSKETAGLSSSDYSAVVFNSPSVQSGGETGVLPNIAVNYYKDLGVLLSFEGSEFSGETLEEYLKSSQVVKDVSPTSLAGLPAWKGKVAGLSEADLIDTVFVENKGRIYVIGVSNRTDFDPKVEDAMISSFKFTNDK